MKRMFWRAVRVAVIGWSLAALPPASAEAQGLATAIQRAANAPIDDVIRDAPTAHPASMMLVAYRLVEVGRRDEALFWFYEGQLRWRARLGDPAYASERARFSRLFDQVGPWINIYAFCDAAAFAQMIDRAIAWDNEHPDATAPALKAETQEGLRRLIAFAREHAGEIDRSQCVASGIDPYVGAGGAIMGRPNELVRAYEPAQFAAFRAGDTTGDQIIEALGRPEWWENGDGWTTLGYSYLRESQLGQFLPGVSQRVMVSFTLNSSHVLRDINLPRDE